MDPQGFQQSKFFNVGNIGTTDYGTGASKAYGCKKFDPTLLVLAPLRYVSPLASIAD